MKYHNCAKQVVIVAISLFTEVYIITWNRIQEYAYEF